LIFGEFRFATRRFLREQPFELVAEKGDNPAFDTIRRDFKEVSDLLEALAIGISENGKQSFEELRIAETLSGFQSEVKLFAKTRRYGKTKSKHRGISFYLPVARQSGIDNTWRYPDHSI
jgi:hypothetical protein